MPRDLCDAFPHLSSVRFQLRIHNKNQVYEPRRPQPLSQGERGAHERSECAGYARATSYADGAPSRLRLHAPAHLPRAYPARFTRAPFVERKGQKYACRATRPSPFRKAKGARTSEASVRGMPVRCRGEMETRHGWCGTTPRTSSRAYPARSTRAPFVERKGLKYSCRATRRQPLSQGERGAHERSECAGYARATSYADGAPSRLRLHAPPIFPVHTPLVPLAPLSSNERGRSTPAAQHAPSPFRKTKGARTSEASVRGMPVRRHTQTEHRHGCGCTPRPSSPRIPRSFHSRPFRRTKGAEVLLPRNTPQPLSQGERGAHERSEGAGYARARVRVCLKTDAPLGFPRGALFRSLCEVAYGAMPLP